MSVIADLDDVKRILRAVPPFGVAKIKIGEATTDHMTTEDAQAFLDAQESYFISRVQFTPASPYEAVLTETVAKLAAFEIYCAMMTLSGASEIPPNVQRWSEWAEKQISNILNGKLKVQTTLSTGSATSDAPRSSDHHELVNETVKMSGTDYNKLQFDRVIRKSETIAYDKAKSVIYTRDTDYNISYDTGEIRRISTGRITDGQIVWVDYTHIHTVDQPAGKKRRSVEYYPSDGTY